MKKMKNKHEKKNRELIKKKLESITLKGEAWCERTQRPITINKYLYSECWVDKGQNLYCQYFNQRKEIK